MVTQVTTGKQVASERVGRTPGQVGSLLVRAPGREGAPSRSVNSPPQRPGERGRRGLEASASPGLQNPEVSEGGREGGGEGAGWARGFGPGPGPCSAPEEPGLQPGGQFSDLHGSHSSQSWGFRFPQGKTQNTLTHTPISFYHNFKNEQKGQRRWPQNAGSPSHGVNLVRGTVTDCLLPREPVTGGGLEASQDWRTGGKRTGQGQSWVGSWGGGWERREGHCSAAEHARIPGHL